MSKWGLLALLGLTVMALAFASGIYLDSIGVEGVSLPMLMAAMIGGMLSTIGFVHWNEERNLEEKFMKQLRLKDRSADAGKLEKFRTKFFVWSISKTMLPILSVLILFCIGSSVVNVILSFITGYAIVETISLSVVLIPFLIWVYRWIKRERKKWKKFGL